jgi:hypothetical protein
MPQMTESLNFMYNVFMSMVRQKNIKLILVAENASQMDYLVDAIVELRREFITKEKMIRVAEIKKSRGIRINNPAYVFTLEDGRFKMFMPWGVDLVQSFKNMPINIVFDEKNLKSVFDSIFSEKGPLQFGTIALTPNASWLFDLWIENFARTQLYRNELLTFTPPNTFDIRAFKAKMLAFLDEMKLETDRYEKNIKIFVTEPQDENKTGKNVIQIPFGPSGFLDTAGANAFVEKFASILKVWEKEGGFKSTINLGVIEPYEVRMKDAGVARTAIFSLIHRFSLLANATFVLLTYIDDPFIHELQKVSSFFIEMSFVHGTPIMNIISPQIQSYYGLLMSPPKAPSKKNFVLYPIV